MRNARWQCLEEEIHRPETLVGATQPSEARSSSHVDELHGVEFKAGVRKGRSFKMVYAYEKTYVKGIISKHANDNITDVQFAKYCMGRQAEETGSAYMVHDSETPDELYVILDTGCNNTCHGSRWMDKFKNYMGMQPELMAADG